MNFRNQILVIRIALLPVVLVIAIAISSNANAQSAGNPEVNPQQPVQNFSLLNLENEVATRQAMVNQLREQIEESQIKMRQIMEQRETLFAKQDQIGVSSESFPEIMKMLQSQRVQLMIDLAGLDARRDALQNARENVESADASAESIKILEELLAVRESQVESVSAMRANGVGSHGDVQSAEVNVLSAKLQLNEAKQTRTNIATPGLNQDLLDASLARAEKQARLAKVESLLETISPSRLEMARGEEAERFLQILTAEVQKLKLELARGVAELGGVMQQLESLRQAEDRSDHNP